MSFLKTWAPYLQSSVRTLGRADQLAGRVEQLPPEPGQCLRARVQGKVSHLVTFADQTSATCTCDRFGGGAYCQHIWAALLDAHQNNFLDAQSRIALEQINPAPPKARKRSSQHQSKNHEPDWIGRLSLLRPSAHDQPTVNLDHLLNRTHIGYVIDSESSTQRSRAVIELWQCQRTPSGWIRTRPLKIGPDTLMQIDDPTDLRIVAAILGSKRVDAQEVDTVRPSGRGHSVFELRAGLQQMLLRQMIQTGRCQLNTVSGKIATLLWDGDAGGGAQEVPWVLWLVGRESDGALDVDLQLRRHDERMAIDRPTVVLTGSGDGSGGGGDGVVIYDNKAALFDDRGASRWVSQFRDHVQMPDQSSAIHIPAGDIERFLSRLYLLAHLPEIDFPAGTVRPQRRVQPQVHLDLFDDRGGNRSASDLSRQQVGASIWFDYEGHRIKPASVGRFVCNEETYDDEGKPHDDHQPMLWRRDVAFEREQLAKLAPLGFRSNTDDNSQTMMLAARQMPGAIGVLTEQGWVVSAQQRLIRRPTAPSLSITTGIDWFELHGGVSFDTDQGPQTILLPQILDAARSGRNMIVLNDGSHGLLPTRWLDRHSLLTAIAQVQSDHLRFKSSQAALLDVLLDQQELARVDEPFDQARQRLRLFDKIKPQHEADTFHGQLRGYQRDGLGWFEFLRWFGAGGILADDMGLGKTVQVLAMLDERYDANGTNAGHKPTLIVAPRSVIFNWIDEAHRFAPKLRVQAYSGADRQMLRQAFKDHDVIVTSYGLMRRDVVELCQHEFDYVVLDEAQMIKNPASQSAKAARLLKTQRRLALTGTPVENHLGDLWSIFEFLNPGMLGAVGRFGQLVRSSMHDQTSDEAALQAAGALRPFILRRTKKQVLTELPDKTEQTIVCQMEPAQRAIYDELLGHYRQTLLKQIRTNQIGRSAIMVLEALLRLRQAACHPGLIDPSYEDYPCVKLDVLAEQLAELIDEGHKVLVFSQFTSFLALVKKRLDANSIVYTYLDGQTRDRQAPVVRFQSDPDCPVFLISLKAGGLGLNLTAAEYVFILDPWWNPAVEQQAIDRAHRIGQTRHVFAYRLVCEDTVEQRIIQLQDKKKKLADAIVGGQGSLLKNLTRDDLQKLLS